MDAPFRLKVRPKQAVAPAVPSADAAQAQMRASFLREQQQLAMNAFTFGWQPVLREGYDYTYDTWERAVSQAIDTLRNSGFIKGAVEQAIGYMIGGKGLQLNLTPSETLALNDPDAWSRDVEARFTAWCNDPWSCDLGGRFTMAQLQAQVCRQFFATGELVSVLPFRVRPGVTHGTKVNVLPSTRLTLGAGPNGRARQGIILDPDGAPAAYVIEQRDLRTEKIEFREVQGRTITGRRAVVHVFDGEPSTLRGMTPFAPVLKVIKQYDQLTDATLTAALIQTIFAATVESDAPTEEILRALQDEDEQINPEIEGAQPGDFDRLQSSRVEWYKNTKIDLGRFGKIAHMFPGEKLTFNRSEHPNGNYKEACAWLMREIAKTLGLTYASVTGDYDGISYTASRMSVSDMWPLIVYRREQIVGRFMDAVFDAWLEEDIALGNTAYPGGLDAYVRERLSKLPREWRGPPKPTADDLKTAKAQQIARAEGWLSTEQIAAEYGTDASEVAIQQARANKQREKLKLPPLPTVGGGGKNDDPQRSAAQGQSGQNEPPEDRDED